ncbi:MAG: hypothetical protein AAF928_04485 [Myxococcota bacterium]
MDETVGRRVCELIAGLIATDDYLHPDELAFMLRTFRAFGVATGERDEAVCPTVNAAEAAKAMASLPASVREETLDLLVASAVADGEVVEAERTYLAAVARVAGLAPDELERRLAAALASR